MVWKDYHIFSLKNFDSIFSSFSLNFVLLLIPKYPIISISFVILINDKVQSRGKKELFTW
jgi:uncharacterized membrane protein